MLPGVNLDPLSTSTPVLEMLTSCSSGPQERLMPDNQGTEPLSLPERHATLVGPWPVCRRPTNASLDRAALRLPIVDRTIAVSWCA